MSAQTILTIKVSEVNDVQAFSEQIESWSSLWWSDLEEAGVDRCLMAFDGGSVVGYQTISLDGLCVAIEVHPDYQGQGIATMLVEESYCYRPESNENPDFWESMENRFGAF